MNSASWQSEGFVFTLSRNSYTHRDVVSMVHTSIISPECEERNEYLSASIEPGSLPQVTTHVLRIDFLRERTPQKKKSIILPMNFYWCWIMAIWGNKNLEKHVPGYSMISRLSTHSSRHLFSGMVYVERLGWIQFDASSVETALTCRWGWRQRHISGNPGRRGLDTHYGRPKFGIAPQIMCIHWASFHHVNDETIRSPVF